MNATDLIGELLKCCIVWVASIPARYRHMEMDHLMSYARNQHLMSPNICARYGDNMDALAHTVMCGSIFCLDNLEFNVVL